MALVHAPHRGHIRVVASVRNAHMTLSYWLAQGGIERHPLRFGYIGFSPGVGSLASNDLFQLGRRIILVLGNEVSRDIPRGNAALAQHSQQRMREILADARAQL